MVKIRDYYNPTDFIVLDMGDEDDIHVILGRPFLNTTGAIIYIRSGEIHFQFPREKVHCYFNSYTTYEQPKKNCSRRRRRTSQRKNNQPIKDGWAYYEGEVTRSDCVPTKDIERSEPQETSSQSKKVWKKKEPPSSPPKVKLEETPKD